MKKSIPLFFSLFFFVSCEIVDVPNKNSNPISSTTSDTNKKTDDTITKPDLVTIFSINDVHGSLKENGDEHELGIAKLDYAIKHDIDYNPDTSIIISCGDTWQGGYLAHEEKTISDELLSMMGVQAMCLGNHEFDWGIDTIKTLKQASPFPFLACNIKNPNGAHTNELSDNSTIIDKGSFKVGVIGVMGSEEEGSIATSSLANYSFDSNTKVIADEVTKLQSQDCDLIVLAAHDSYQNSSNYINSIGNTFSTTEIQGIFGAHTHRFESALIGSHQIPFVQGGSNTRGYAKISFSLKEKKAIEKSYVDAFYQNYNVDSSQLNLS